MSHVLMASVVRFESEIAVTLYLLRCVMRQTYNRSNRTMLVDFKSILFFTMTTDSVLKESA